MSTTPPSTLQTILVKDPADTSDKSKYVYQFNGNQSLYMRMFLKKNNTVILWIYGDESLTGDVFCTTNYKISFNVEKKLSVTLNVTNDNTPNTPPPKTIESSRVQHSKIWTHYAIVSTGTNCEIFMNGIQVATQPGSLLFDDYSGIAFGGYEYTPTFVGYMFGMKLFNRVYSKKEIMEDMNASGTSALSATDSYRFDKTERYNLLLPLNVPNVDKIMPITYNPAIRNFVMDPVSSSVINNVYEFDGSFSFYFQMQLQRENAVMAWIYTGTPGKGTGDVLCSTNFKVTFNGTSYLTVIYNAFEDSATTIVCPVSQTFAWTHYAIVSDGVYCTIYVNGTQMIGPVNASLTQHDFSGMTIGGYENKPGFTGYMYDMQIFNRKVTTDDIENALKNRIYEFSYTPYTISQNEPLSGMYKYPPTKEIINPPLNLDVSTYNEPNCYMVHLEADVPYGNGKYYISSSKELDHGAAYLAFTESDRYKKKYWNAGQPDRDIIKFNVNIKDRYTGGVGMKYPGEYLKIKCPEAFYLYHYIIEYTGDVNIGDPKKWILAGSMNNTTWTKLDQRNYSFYTDPLPKNKYTFTITNPNEMFSHYVLIYQSYFGTDSAIIQEIGLYGKPDLAVFKDPEPNAYRSYTYTSYANRVPSDYTSSLTSAENKTLEECHQICDTETNCKAFTYDIATSKCNTYQESKAVTFETTPNSELTTYVKHTDYFKINNYDSSGNDILKNTNATACKTECDKNDTCVGYALDNSNGSCSLKDAYTATDASSNYTSLVSSKSHTLYMKTATAPTPAKTDDVYNYIFNVPQVDQKEDLLIPSTVNGHPLLVKENTNDVILGMDPTGSDNYMYRFTGSEAAYLQMNVPTPVRNTRTFWVYTEDDEFFDVTEGGGLYSSEHYNVKIVKDNTQDNKRIIICSISAGATSIEMASNSIDDFKWYHVAIVSDGKNMTMYINGKFDKTVAIIPNYTYAIDPSVIKFGKGFPGYMYGMRLYPYPLTNIHVNVVYNFQKIKSISKDLTIIPPQLDTNLSLNSALSRGMNVEWKTIAANADGSYSIAFNSHNNIFISSSFGTIWNYPNNIGMALNKFVDANVNKCVMSIDGTYIVIGTEKGLHFTYSPDKTSFTGWTALNQTENFVEVAISNDKSTILGATEPTTGIGGYVYLSKNTNDPTIWKPLQKIYNEQPLNSIKLSISQDGMIIVVTGMTPSGTGLATAKSIPVAVKSIDGGSTWSDMNPDILEFDQTIAYTNAMSKDGKTIVLCAKYFYIYKETEDAKSDNPTTLAPTGWSMKYLKIENNMENLDDVNAIRGALYKNVFINDTGNIICTYDKFNIYVSLNSGENWNNYTYSNDGKQKIKTLYMTKSGNLILYSILDKLSPIYYMKIQPPVPRVTVTGGGGGGAITNPGSTSGIGGSGGAITNPGSTSGIGAGGTETGTETGTGTVATVEPTRKPPHQRKERLSIQNNFPIMKSSDLLYNQISGYISNSVENFEGMDESKLHIPLPPLDSKQYDLNLLDKPNGWKKESLKTEIGSKLDMFIKTITPNPSITPKPYDFDLKSHSLTLKTKFNEDNVKTYVPGVKAPIEEDSIPVAMTNSNFNVPKQARNGWNFYKTTQINGWKIDGNMFTGLANGSGTPWCDAALPLPMTQFFFVQAKTENGFVNLTQSLSLTAGYHNLSFVYSARKNKYDSNFILNVYIGNTQIVSNLIADPAKWQLHSTGFYFPQGNYTLKFEFKNAKNGDFGYGLTGLKLLYYEKEPNTSNEKSKLSCSVTDHFKISGNLFSILNIDQPSNTLSNGNGQQMPKKYIGDGSPVCETYICTNPNCAYKKHCNTVTDENDGKCKCVCTDTTISKGEPHTHCSEMELDNATSESDSNTFDALMQKVKSIQIKGVRPSEQTTTTIHDPQTSDLVEMISNYYISLLRNKKLFDEFKELENLSKTTNQFHKDANTEYKENYMKIVNLGIGIFSAFALMLMFSKK